MLEIAWVLDESRQCHTAEGHCQTDSRAQVGMMSYERISMAHRIGIGFWKDCWKYIGVTRIWERGVFVLKGGGVQRHALGLGLLRDCYQAGSPSRLVSSDQLASRMYVWSC